MGHQYKRSRRAAPGAPWLSGAQGAAPVLGVCLLLAGCHSSLSDKGMQAELQSPLQRAKVFLAAGDFRHAVEACQEQVRARPSAASYVYLTYVYQAIGGFLDHHASRDEWVKVEQLSRNLLGGKVEQVVDPPDIMARVAKELIHESVEHESDVAAAQATRLDQAEVARLWEQQRAWRQRHPHSWWHGVPDAWHWEGTGVALTGIQNGD